jgi:hypothetical protein
MTATALPLRQMSMALYTNATTSHCTLVPVCCTPYLLCTSANHLSHSNIALQCALIAHCTRFLYYIYKSHKKQKGKGLPGDKLSELKGMDPDQMLSILVENKIIAQVSSANQMLSILVENNMKCSVYLLRTRSLHRYIVVAAVLTPADTSNSSIISSSSITCCSTSSSSVGNSCTGSHKHQQQ